MFFQFLEGLLELQCRLAGFILVWGSLFLRVARAVVEKARTFVRGIVPAEPETIVDAATLFASKPEVEIQADSRIFAAEQITLFAA